MGPATGAAPVALVAVAAEILGVRENLGARPILCVLEPGVDAAAAGDGIFSGVLAANVGMSSSTSSSLESSPCRLPPLAAAAAS